MPPILETATDAREVARQDKAYLSARSVASDFSSKAEGSISSSVSDRDNIFKAKGTALKTFPSAIAQSAKIIVSGEAKANLVSAASGVTSAISNAKTLLPD